MPSRAEFTKARTLPHGLLYLYEAAELALFMLSACLFTSWLSPIPNPWLQRALMGSAMALTAIAIIRSPIGKASGAHFNPAITLTFYRLGKIGLRDALCYIIFQFAGGLAGVYVSALILGSRIADPAVNYAVTVPGKAGPIAAFCAETFMAALLMATVLFTSGKPRLAPFTTWLVGMLIAAYILLLAPVSGFSINPARTLASAIPAHVYTSLWIYFTAPFAGMFFSAELYLRVATPHPAARQYLTHRHLTQRSGKPSA